MQSGVKPSTDNCLIVTTPPGYCAEWDWILSVVLEDWLGLSFRRQEKPDAHHVSLSVEGSLVAEYRVTLGANFWLQSVVRDNGYSDPIKPLAEWTPELQSQKDSLVQPRIPVLFGSSGDTDLPIDIFGSAFWMMSRIEEVSSRVLDNHDRFPATQALAVQEGFIQRPIVDEYVALLRQALSDRFPFLHLRAPEFRMYLSHDVDAPSQFGLGMSMPWVKGVVQQISKGRNAKGLAIAARRLFKTPQRIESGDPMNSFDFLMSQSEKRGLASSFYFFGGRTDVRKDAGYLLSHPAINSLLKEINARGHEIGLHPSYNTYLNPTVLASEARNLIECCEQLDIHQDEWGGRMHYLRWRWPDTSYAWELAGLAYDSTLGFAEIAGFRCGTSHEYRAFDPLAKMQLSLRIRPLIAMECSVIAARYMNLGYGEAAYECMFKLKDRCRKYGGGFSLLWHNSHFTTDEDRALYEAVLDR